MARAIRLLRKAAEELPLSDWVSFHHIKNESGIPIEFDNHNFMKALYDDWSPLQVWLKPPQIGATVAQIIKTMFGAKRYHWDIIYTLPTQGDVSDMAGGKINRLIAQNPVFVEWIKDHDTIEQKSVGENIIYYRGTFTQKAAMMVSSDLNVHDEVDASDSKVILQYETRLQAKKDGRRWYFSHPSIAGYGVDIYWQQSDKKEWFITCPACQTEQILTWPDNINLQTKTYICSTCKALLPDSVRRKGVWRSTADGIFSGYHISQLMCPWISAEKIINDFNDESKGPQYFYNYVLGLPYVASDNKIDPQVVLKNCTSKVNDQLGNIIIGVDTGLPIHYTVLNRDGIFFYKKCKPPSANYDPYNELEALLIKFPQSIMVADQGGDLIGIRRLQAKYPGRIFLCFYRKDRKSNQLIRWGEGKDYGIVTVDRNRLITMMVEQFRDTGRIPLNGTKEEFEEFARHYGNIYRVVKPPEESHYGVEYLWDRNGPDHFVHSTGYALVGLDKFGTTMATVVEPDIWEGVPTGRIFNE